MAKISLMRFGLTGAYLPTYLAAGQDVQVRRNLGQRLRGNPDINTGELSDLSRPGIEHLAELGIAEGHCQRRLNGTADGPAGIGMQTGRYVN